MEAREDKRFTIFLMSCIPVQSSPKKRQEGALTIPKSLEKHTIKQQDTIIDLLKCITKKILVILGVYKNVGKLNALHVASTNVKCTITWKPIQYSCNKAHTHSKGILPYSGSNSSYLAEANENVHPHKCSEKHYALHPKQNLDPITMCINWR